MAQNNQNLQNTANQRAQELKPNRQTTGAAETSKASDGGQDQTRVDGNVNPANRDVETFAPENSNDRAHGGNDSEVHH